MIIKNFLGEYQSNNGVEEFSIKWDYISFPDGTEIGPQQFLVPSNLIAQEFILRWNNGPVFDTALSNNSTPPAIAWYVNTYFLEYYFTDSKAIWNKTIIEPYIPEVYNVTSEIEWESDINFKAYGKNFPGQLNSGQYTPEYPGILTTGSPDRFSNDSISTSLLKAFLENLTINEGAARESWDTIFGPNTGTEFSASLLGLTRDDYSFTKVVPKLLKSVVNKIVSNNLAYDSVFITSLNSAKVISKNSIEDFKYSLNVSIEADIALAVIQPGLRPVIIYNGDQAENTPVINSYGLNISLLPERYEPEIVLENIILPSEFVRGYKYKFLAGQTFPSGFIALGPNTGRYPSLGGPRDLSPDIRLFEGKGTNAIVQFLFDLFKLRRGKSYDLSTDRINTGPEDFQRLTLFSQPQILADVAVADDLVGNSTNLVTVWLPFSYKRDGAEWRLAHDICAAFLNNYTIGYHEFTADFSVAEEPVNTIEGYGLPPVYLDVCEIFSVQENLSVSYTADPNIVNPNAVSYNTSPSITNPAAISYTTN